MNQFWKGILKYIAAFCLMLTAATFIFAAQQLISPVESVYAATLITPVPISGLTVNTYVTTAPTPNPITILTDGKTTSVEVNNRDTLSWCPSNGGFKTYDNYCTITKSSTSFSFGKMAISFYGSLNTNQYYPYGTADYDGTPKRSPIDRASDDYKFLIGAGGTDNGSIVYYPRVWFPRKFQVKVTYANGTSEILAVTPRLDMVLDPLHPFISSNPGKFIVSVDTDEPNLKSGNKTVAQGGTSISYYRIVLSMVNPCQNVTSIQLFDMSEGNPVDNRNVYLNEIQLYDKFDDVQNVKVTPQNPIVGSDINLGFDIATKSAQAAKATIYYRLSGKNVDYSNKSYDIQPEAFGYKNISLKMPSGITNDFEYYIVITQNGQDIYKSPVNIVDIRVPVTSMSAPGSMTLDRGCTDTINVSILPLDADRKDVRFTVSDSVYLSAPTSVKISRKGGVAIADITAKSKIGRAYLKIEAGDPAYPNEYFTKTIPIDIVPVRLKTIDFHQSITLANINDAESNSKTLQVHCEPSNAEIASVEWSIVSSSPNGIIDLVPNNTIPADKVTSVIVKTNRIGSNWGTAGTGTVRMKLTTATGEVITKDCMINITSSNVPLVKITKVSIPDSVQLDSEFDVTVQISPPDATFGELDFSSSNTNFIIEKNNTEQNDGSGIIHKRFKAIGGSGNVSMMIVSKKYPQILFSQDIHVTVPVTDVLVTDSTSGKRLVDGENVNKMDMLEGAISYITASAVTIGANEFRVPENNEVQFVAEDDNITILNKIKNSDSSYTIGIKANHTGSFYLRVTTSNLLVTEEIEINVYKNATSLVLDNNQISLTSNENAMKLNATLLPTNSKNEPIGWKSSNPDVVRVDSTGKVTALQQGMAYVTAMTTSGLEATCLVNSNFPIKFEAENAELYKQAVTQRQGASGGANSVDMRVDGYINFKMYAPQTGDYDLELYYMVNTALFADRDACSITVNVNEKVKNTLKVNGQLTNAINFNVANNGMLVLRQDQVKLSLDQGLNNVKFFLVPNANITMSLDYIKVYGVFKPNTNTTNISFPDQKTIYAGEQLNLVEEVGITPKNIVISQESWQVYAMDGSSTSDVLEMKDSSKGIILAKKAGQAKIVTAIQTLDSAQIITKSCVITVLENDLKGIAIQKNGREITMVDHISLTTDIDQRIMAVTYGNSNLDSGYRLATTDTQYIRLFMDPQEPAKADVRICTNDFTNGQQVSVFVYAQSNPMVKLETLIITLLKRPAPADVIHFYIDDLRMYEITNSDMIDLKTNECYKVFSLVTGIDGTPASDQEIIWSSDKPESVSVDQTGEITAIGLEDTTAIITAKTHSGIICNTVEVHVQPVMITGELSESLVCMGMTEGSMPGEYLSGYLATLKKTLDTSPIDRNKMIDAWYNCKKFRNFDQDTILSLWYEALDYYNSLPDSVKTAQAGKTFYDTYIKPYDPASHDYSLDTGNTIRNTYANNLINQIATIEKNNAPTATNVLLNKYLNYYNQQYDIHMGNHVIEIDNVALQNGEATGLTLMAFDQNVGADSITQTGNTYTLKRVVDGKILYIVEGIPIGIHVLPVSIPSENKIKFKLLGSPLNPITSDVSINITLCSPIMVDAWGNSSVNSKKITAILKAFQFLNVDATMDDNTMQMKSLNQPDEEDAITVKVDMPDSTLKAQNLLFGTDFTTTYPLPKGLEMKGKTNPENNTILFTLSGSTINPITDTIDNEISLGNIFNISMEKQYKSTKVNGKFQILAFKESRDGGSRGTSGGGDTSGGMSYMPSPFPTPTVPPTPGPTSVSKPFDDDANIPEWAYSSIKNLVQRQVVDGLPTQDGGKVFDPNGYITRAQFAKLLVKALGLTLGENKQSFTDVGENAWYYKDIQTVASLGIAKGFEGKFNPDGNITREEMVVMLVNAMKIAAPGDYQADELQYDDKDTMSQWSRQAISIATKLALIKGYSGNTFGPKELSNRAQAAVVIFRILEQLKKL